MHFSCNCNSHRFEWSGTLGSLKSQGKTKRRSCIMTTFPTVCSLLFRCNGAPPNMTPLVWRRCWQSLQTVCCIDRHVYATNFPPYSGTDDTMIVSATPLASFWTGSLEIFVTLSLFSAHHLYLMFCSLKCKKQLTQWQSSSNMLWLGRVTAADQLNVLIVSRSHKSFPVELLVSCFHCAVVIVTFPGGVSGLLRRSSCEVVGLLNHEQRYGNLMGPNCEGTIYFVEEFLVVVEIHQSPLPCIRHGPTSRETPIPKFKFQIYRQ